MAKDPDMDLLWAALVAVFHAQIEVAKAQDLLKSRQPAIESAMAPRREDANG